MAKILIVDDSEAYLHSLAKLVEAEGHEVITANSGEQGVEEAKAAVPDVILMDIVMPGMSGFQATRKIAKEDATKDIPIIFVTTKDQETDRIWGMRQGATAYITKPVDKKELVSAINKAILS